jgi:hypothetical protein
VVTGKQLVIVAALAGGGLLLWRAMADAAETVPGAPGRFIGPAYLPPELFQRELTDAEKAASALGAAGALAGAGAAIIGALTKALGGGTTAATAAETARQAQRAGERGDYSLPRLSVPDFQLTPTPQWVGGFNLWDPGGGPVLASSDFTLVGAGDAPVLRVADFSLYGEGPSSVLVPDVVSTAAPEALEAVSALGGEEISAGGQMLARAFTSLEPFVAPISAVLNTVIPGTAVLAGEAAVSAAAATGATVGLTIGQALPIIGVAIMAVTMILTENPWDGYLAIRKTDGAHLVAAFPVLWWRVLHATTRPELYAAVTEPLWVGDARGTVSVVIDDTGWLLIRGVHLDTGDAERQLNALYQSQLALILSAEAGDPSARAAVAKIAANKRIRLAASGTLGEWLPSANDPGHLLTLSILDPAGLAVTVNRTLREMAAADLRRGDRNPALAGLAGAAAALGLDVDPLEEAYRYGALALALPTEVGRGPVYTDSEGGIQADRDFGAPLPGVFVTPDVYVAPAPVVTPSSAVVTLADVFIQTAPAVWQPAAYIAQDPGEGGLTLYVTTPIADPVAAAAVQELIEASLAQASWENDQRQNMP